MADGTPLTLQHTRHLLRRTGFGASQSEATEFMADHPTRGAAADALLAFKPAGFKPVAATWTASTTSGSSTC
jgi:hypothetical protein